MTDETEKRILNAALTIFARKGRDAATTKAIAEKAGRTEMTLFRKFGTKQNLFEKVMIQNLEKMKEDIDSIIHELDGKFKSPEMFLEAYVKSSVAFFENNIEVFTLIYNDNNPNVEPLLDDINNSVGEFISRNLQENTGINPRALGIYINAYIYYFSLEVYNGRDVQFDQKIKGLIDNLNFCF